jgi:hypothetical protein
VNLIEQYDTIIGLTAIIAALGMMIGTGMAVLALGIWALRKALKK